MTYAMVFDTVASYLAAKASSGAIYNKLTSSNYLSRAVTSVIDATGETFIDAVNTIVPREAGEIGDLLLYKGGTYSWLKSTVAYSATSLGQQAGILAEITAAGYKPVGYCWIKTGRDCILASAADLGGYAWSNNTTDLVPGMTGYSGVHFQAPEVAAGYRSNWIGPFSLYVSELRYPSSNPEWGDWQYVLPFQRSVWNTVVSKIESRTAASGTMTSGSWSVAFNSSTNRWEGIITFSHSAVGTRTVNVLDYDCNFDLWYKRAMIARLPALDKSDSAGGDRNGKRNTGCMLHFAGGSPAATAAAGHAVSDCPDYGAGKWWLGSMGEWLEALRNIEIWHKKGCPFNMDSYYWTSSRYSSASAAWSVNALYAHVYYSSRTNGFQVRPFSAFHI